MRLIAFLAAGLAMIRVLVLPSLAATADQGWIGNTFVYSADVDADILHKVYRSDHTWVSWFPNSAKSRGNAYDHPHRHGTWVLNATGVLCETYFRSALRPHQTDCAPLGTHRVGDSWTDTNGASVKLLPGIQ